MVTFDEELSLWEVRVDGRQLTVYEAEAAGMFLEPKRLERDGHEFIAGGASVIGSLVYFQTKDDALDAEDAWEDYLTPRNVSVRRS